MTGIFSLPGPLLLVVSALFGLACVIAALAMLAWGHRRHLRSVPGIPVAPFFTGITTVWALSLGFVAADLWSVRAQAEQAASAERSSMTRLHGMAGSEALDLPALREALAHYSAAVREMEWKENANAKPAEPVEAALQEMRLALIALARSAAPQPLMAKMTQDFDELQDARNTRLAIGQASVSEYKWYLVLVLTVLSAVAIASVHADRPPAGRTALAIFAAAAVVSLWVLAMHANPYAGSAAIAFMPPTVPAPG